jgi:Fuc2NAc and GlcNAc transferase
VKVVWLVASGCGVACLLTFLARYLALRHGVMDHPSGRSSHNVPTPRGGGVAIVLTVAAAAPFIAARVPDAVAPFGAVILPTLVVALLGLLDDRYSLTAGLRLVVQLACAVSCIAAVTAIVRPVPSVGTAAVLVFCVFATLWCTNLYNFMDGIDGIAGTEGLFVSVAAAVLISGRDASGIAELLWVTAGACGGFLVWNWQPARIFMGDVGSAALGFLFAAVATFTWLTGAMSPWVWAILLGAFVTDATVTLLVRWRRGEKLMEAHRSHAYQRVARKLGSHGSTVGWLLALNLLWLLPIAALAQHWPGHAPWLACLALGPLAVAAYRSGAGRADESG